MEFNNIYLLKGIFNYFNRKIYFYESLEDYLDLAEDYEVKEDVNFNPNEGVNTSLVVSLASAVNYFEYCYLLVTDKDNKIISRWYIKDATRNLSGQFTLTLRRDVVAESFASFDFVNNAPIYVEKGILPDTDPMIVNSEGMSFNQIKKGEYLISDGTGWGYICGYIANDANLAEKTLPADNSTPEEYYTAAQLATATGITAADIESLLGGSPVTFAMTDLSLVFGLTVEPLILVNPHKIELKIPNSLSGNMGALYDNTVNAWSHAVGSVENDAPFAAASRMRSAIQNDYSSFRSGLNSILSTLTETFYNRNNFDSLEQYDGKVIFYNGAYYYMTVSRGGTTPHAEVVIPEGGVNYFDNLVSVMNLHTYYPDWELYLNYSVASVSITLEPVQSVSLKYKISSSHAVLKDAPYSMFVIPYGDNVRTSNKDYIKKRDAMRVASSIATNLGGTTGKIYDLQLLPYFPEHDRWIRRLPVFPVKYGLSLLGKTETIDYDKILDGDNDEVGAILYMKVSNVSFSKSINVTLFSGAVVDEPKIESQCSFWRLCSPNYNGVFEFNIAKNGGEPFYVFIDCTFKPYNPFIRVTPKFKFLYGQNYKDGRGLICGGDFSLPIINDSWTNYELRNKNYGAIFARDIQNLDVGLRQERFKEPFVIGAGIVGAGVAGGVAGGKAGGPYGAAAGAAVGLGAGIIGGALDAKLAEERRAETKDYAIDRFNLSLANIKALPDSLAKNSAFNIVNKIFPFIEYYTCTDEEKEALRNKIKYDGMTVGRIDTISTFMGGNEDQKYFKGQLIRALGIFDNEDFIEALYNELAKGVYI